MVERIEHVRDGGAVGVCDKQVGRSVIVVVEPSGAHAGAFVRDDRAIKDLGELGQDADEDMMGLRSGVSLGDNGVAAGLGGLGWAEGEDLAGLAVKRGTFEEPLSGVGRDGVRDPDTAVDRCHGLHGLEERRFGDRQDLVRGDIAEDLDIAGGPFDADLVGLCGVPEPEVGTQIFCWKAMLPPACCICRTDLLPTVARTRTRAPNQALLEAVPFKRD